jgi:hypothetical protein
MDDEVHEVDLFEQSPYRKEAARLGLPLMAVAASAGAGSPAWCSISTAAASAGAGSPT